MLHCDGEHVKPGQQEQQAHTQELTERESVQHAKPERWRRKGRESERANGGCQLLTGVAGPLAAREQCADDGARPRIDRHICQDEIRTCAPA